MNYFKIHSIGDVFVFDRGDTVPADTPQLIVSNNSIQHNITVDKGVTYSEEFVFEVLTDPLTVYDEITNPYVPLNISSSEIILIVRPYFGSQSTIIEASTNNGRITITSVGKILLTLLPEDTRHLSVSSGEVFVYDLKISITSTNIIKPITGNFIVKGSV